jgi:broad specificity phosphatase PhoE
MSQRLSLVAHAATEAQRHARFPDDESIEQIDAPTRAAVIGRLGRVERARHAPERAAEETAHALGLATAADDQLRSWSMGSWKGREIVDVAEHEPAAFAAWRQDPDAAPGGGAESLRDLLERAGRWLDDLPDTSERRLVIADATLICAVLVNVLGVAAPAFWHFDLAPLSLTVVQRNGSTWRVRCLGCDALG